jgi:hypothetical protein
MIQNDDIDAAGAKPSDGFNGGGAAIDRQDEGDGMLVEAILDPFGAESVPLVHAMGKEMGDLPTQTFQELDQEGGGGDAVDVVISVNDEGFSLGSGPKQAIHGDPHVGEQERVRKILEAGIEKAGNGLRGGEVPIDEALSEEGGDAAFAR